MAIFAKGVQLTKHRFIDKLNINLIGNIFILLVSATVAQFLNFVSLLLIARYLGVETYGQYTATLTLLTQAAIILNFGMDTWLLQESSKSAESFATNANNALFLRVVLTAPWLAVVVLVAPFLNPHVYLTSIVAMAGLGVAFHVTNLLVQSVFKAQIRNHITIFLQISNALLFLLSTLYLIQQNSNLFEFMQARTLAIGCVLVISLFLFYRFHGFKIQWSKLLLIYKKAISFFAIDMLSYIYAMADVTIIAIWLGNTAVGIYSPAIVLINAVYLILNAIQGAVLPVFSRIYATNKIGIRLPSILLVSGLIIVGTAMAMVLQLFAPFIISLLYGSAFQESSYILSLLSPVLLLKCVNFSFGIILIAIHAQNDRVFVQSVVAIINISLNIVCITHYGLTGVVCIFILTEFSLLLGYSGLVAYQFSQIPSAHLVKIPTLSE